MFDDLMVSFDKMMMEFDEMMNTMGETIPKFKCTSSVVDVSPPIDLFISQDTVYLRIALPGYIREEITVNVNDNFLIVEANVRGGSSGYNPKIIRKKSQIIKENIKLEWKVNPNIHDINAIDANLNLGILYINIPFKKVETPKTVERKVEIK